MFQEWGMNSRNNLKTEELFIDTSFVNRDDKSTK